MFKKLKTTIITSSFLLIIFLSHFIAYPLFAKIALKPIVNFEDRVVIEGFSMIAVCAILLFAFILFGAIKNLILTIISEIREFKDFLKTRKDPTNGRVSALDPVWPRQTSQFEPTVNFLPNRHDPMPEPEWVKVYQNTQEELNKKIQVNKPPKNNKLKFLNK